MPSLRKLTVWAFLLASVLLLGLAATWHGQAQQSGNAEDEEANTTARTMRPIIRGRYYAATSIKPEATRAAERILEAGGNAFDAIVAGQATPAVTDAAMNGLGSDAVILLYDARAKKVFSINAEGTAPQLATIEWYQKNQDGKLPQSDGLLVRTVPGVVDVWYILLDRWGTMSFAQVLAQAIDLAENGFPISNGLARTIERSRKIRKYPSTTRVYLPNGQAPTPGDIFRNTDLARTLKKLVEAEKQNANKGRHEALKAVRDRFYKGEIAREMAKFSEENGGLFRYEDFANYTAKLKNRFRPIIAAIASTRTLRRAKARWNFSCSIYRRAMTSRHPSTTAPIECGG